MKRLFIAAALAAASLGASAQPASADWIYQRHYGARLLGYAPIYSRYAYYTRRWRQPYRVRYILLPYYFAE